MKINQEVLFSNFFSSSPETEEELLAWAKDLSLALTSFNREVNNSLNNHILNPLSHTASWKLFRRNRNYFLNSTNAGTTITFPASTKQPIFLSTGELRQATSPSGYQGFSTSSNLTCNLATNGVGGLDTGAIAADKVYYFYAVVNGEEVGIIASLNDPSTGPTGYGYGEWMYQGSAATFSGAANFPMFIHSNGHTVYADEVKLQAHTGTTSRTAFTLNALPTTAKFAYCSFSVTGVIQGIGYLSGSSNAGDFTMQQRVGGAAVNNFFIGPSLIPLIESKKIYAELSSASITMNIYVLGHLEDPTEWS